MDSVLLFGVCLTSGMYGAYLLATFWQVYKSEKLRRAYYQRMNER
jgi:hypothetical protein